MRIPNPKAVTTTEAYLAYKAEVLEQSELKDKLYHPYLHIDGWLAYWTGLTETYPTDKNGDPECLTDEEAYIAYLAGVTSEYPEALKDPADVRVASYLRYLISVRFGRPDYPVTREELYLSMIKPRFIPSGDPSSEIELDGTVEAPFIDLKMYGDTFQQTYSGKNLLNVNFTNDSLSGLTFTNNGDSTITISGKITASYGFNISPASANNLVLSSGKTYTQRLEVISGSLGGLSLVPAFKDSGGTIKYNYFNNNQTVTTTDTMTNYQYNIYWGAATIGDEVNATIRVWLEEGNNLSSPFEPYVGGTASPNPDYPQDINVVTGEQTVTVHGKNLFDLTSLAATNITVASGVANGTATAFYNAWKNGITLPPFTGQLSLSATAYTDGNSSTSNVVGLKIRISYTDGTNVDGIAWNNSDTSAVSKTYTTDASKTVSYIAITYQNTGSNIWHLSNFQIEQSASPTPYEPYQSTTKTINLGSTELAKIGTYVDGIFNNDPSKSWYNPDLEDNAWYVHKAVGKVVLDGSESWTATGGGNGYRIEQNDIVLTPASDEAPIKCDYFTVTTFSDIYSARIDYGISNHNNNHWIVLRDKNWTSATDVITWLSSHNTTVYYALATPTDTKITDATLIVELDDLMEGGSYNGKTYIKVTATDPNLPGLLYVEAAI